MDYLFYVKPRKLKVEGFGGQSCALFSFIFLAVWDLNSLTRNQICAPCIESKESQPLDNQASPLNMCFRVKVWRPKGVSGSRVNAPVESNSMDNVT